MVTQHASRVRYDCNCCGYFTLHRDPDGDSGSPAPCPVCHWTYDRRQQNDPGFVTAANGISLRAARTNFHRFGAARESALALVRPATRSEMNEPW